MYRYTSNLLPTRGILAIGKITKVVHDQYLRLPITGTVGRICIESQSKLCKLKLIQAYPIMFRRKGKVYVPCSIYVSFHVNTNKLYLLSCCCNIILVFVILVANVAMFSWSTTLRTGCFLFIIQTCIQAISLPLLLGNSRHSSSGSQIIQKY